MSERMQEGVRTSEVSMPVIDFFCVRIVLEVCELIFKNITVILIFKREDTW